MSKVSFYLSLIISCRTLFLLEERMKKLLGIVVLMGMSFSAYSLDMDYIGRYGSCRVTCQDADPSGNLTCTLSSMSWSNVETLHGRASKAGIYCSANVMWSCCRLSKIHSESSRSKKTINRSAFLPQFNDPPLYSANG